MRGTVIARREAQRQEDERHSDRETSGIATAFQAHQLPCPGMLSYSGRLRAAGWLLIERHI